MNLFYLHLAFQSRDDRCPLSYVRWSTRLIFPIWLTFPLKDCPVGWGWDVEYTDCILCGEVRPPNECPGYDTKHSDGDVPVMLGLWGIRSTTSLPSLPGPLGPDVIAPIYGLNRANGILMLNWLAKWVECSPRVQVASYQRLVLDTSLLNTQQYKVRIKG